MKIISSELLLETPIFTVTRDVAFDPDGFEIQRAIVRHQGSAVVMPVDDKDRILLVKQYRLPAKKFLWELPAGRIDPGETALQAAKRELKEETGLRAKKWTKLVKYWASPGFLEEAMNLYLAQELTQGEATPMEDERIERRWFGKRELGQLIAEGQIEDGKTIIGFHLFGAQKRKKQP
jgi:ADP-ribose pyrophosphatase